MVELLTAEEGELVAQPEAELNRTQVSIPATGPLARCCIFNACSNPAMAEFTCVCGQGWVRVSEKWVKASARF